jgi:hypothetical protein
MTLIELSGIWVSETHLPFSPSKGLGAGTPGPFAFLTHFAKLSSRAKEFEQKTCWFLLYVGRIRPTDHLSVWVSSPAINGSLILPIHPLERYCCSNGGNGTSNEVSTARKIQNPVRTGIPATARGCAAQVFSAASTANGFRFSDQ